MKIAKRILLITLLYLNFNVGIAQQFYVQPFGNGDGSSWANAANLNTILQNATAGTVIWVQQGTYLPVACNPCSTMDRETSFVLPDGVAVYGGFDGTETALDQRDWANRPTILSGDIDQNGDFANNSYTILSTVNVSDATILDGFILKDANADSPIHGQGAVQTSGGAWFNKGEGFEPGSNPSIRNCVFKDNKVKGFGAAMMNDGSNDGKANPSYKNCSFENNSAEGGGGAVYNFGSFGGNSNPVFTTCVFRNNSSLFDGGGISNVGSENGNSSPRFYTCTFENNYAEKHGGGVLNFGKSGTSSPFFSDCLFHNNDAYIGGGLHNDGTFQGQANSELRNCTFTENLARAAGGAIYNLASDNGNSNPIFYNLYIKANQSNGAGAGIFNNAINGICNPTITNCIVLSNHADTYGGGIYNLGKGGDCSPTLTNCLIAKNTGLSAGGMYCLGSENGNSSPVVTNCTFYGNAAIVGGGIYANASDPTGNSSPLVRNCIIVGNTADFGSVFRCIYGTPRIEDSVVDKEDCLSLNSGIGSAVDCGPGVLYNVDPLFVDPANDNFHLLPISPLRDIGNNAAINETGVLIDLDSTLRINNGTVDIGAFEYNAVEYVVPSFIEQPTDIVACNTEITAFSVFATGTPPLNFQWQKNGTNIQNATSDVLTLEDLDAADEGNYRCLVISPLSDTIVSSVASLTVQPLVDASIEVLSSANAICTGELVEFSILSANEGASPAYDWIINGLPTGNTSTAFSSSTLEDGDIVGCILNSSMLCAQNNPIISNAITMSVTNAATASISVEASSMEVCAGESVSFSATIENGGTNPVYQWLLNGENVGINNPSYTNGDLVDGDAITCQLTSSASCLNAAQVSSTPIAITVNDLLSPSLSIASNLTTICEGQQISFTANAVDVGATTSFQWQVNGENVGTDSDTYVNTNFQNGDVIACILNTAGACLTATENISNMIQVSVEAQLNPSISVLSSATEICTGELVSFEATTSDSGTTSVYQWQVNGENVGTNSATFENDALADGDIVTCVLSTTGDCLSSNTAVSNDIVLAVANTVSPTINIIGSAMEICAGDEITFSAEAVNGGNNPVYQWQVNGENVGTNTPSFSSTNLEDHAIITCMLSSDQACLTTTTAISNSLEIIVQAIENQSITIDASANEICAGEVVNFISNNNAVGTNPSYQWQINGQAVGMDNPEFESNLLQEGDIVSCLLSVTGTCLATPTVSSNDILMTVYTPMTPSIQINSSATSYCEGAFIELTTSTAHAGDSPSYQWFVNGMPAGTSASLSSDAFNNEDLVSCQLQSSASCLTTDMAESDDFQINLINPVTPTIEIFASSMAICENEAITFWAEATNTGDTPSYQWLLNGEDLGEYTASFTSSTIQDNDVLLCVINSSIDCLTENSITSNNLLINVLAPHTASIEITTLSPTICAGEPASFTATTVSGGDTPSYQWFINTTAVGENSANFETTNLTTGDIVSCVLSSSEDCLTANNISSNEISVTVNNELSSSIEILTNSEVVCAGEVVDFTSVVSNPGFDPVYQWHINGQNVGSNSPFFSTDMLQSGDEITCTLTSSSECVVAASVNSPAIEMLVLENISPSVTISVSAEIACAGDELTFVANTTNGGDNPQLDWYWNGSLIVSNQAIYTTSSLEDGDEIHCVLTSDANCLATTMASSNLIHPNIIAADLPTIEILSDNTNICEGDPVLFASLASNEGDNPSYEWFVNGNSIGQQGGSTIIENLNEGDAVFCVLTSNAPCLDAPTVASNSWLIELAETVVVSVETELSTTSICAGEAVFLQAIPSNGGSNPSFAWYVNGEVVSNLQSFETTTLANQDEIYVEVLSSASCAVGTAVASATTVMSVTDLLTPSLSIHLDSLSSVLCPGDSLQFRVETFNAGTDPSVEWFVNEDLVASDAYLFTTDMLAEGDLVRCELTANDPCVESATVLSNSLSIIFDAACIDAVTDINPNPNLRVLPNPSQGHLTIQLDAINTAFDLQILGVDGIRIETQRVSSLQNHQGYRLDLSHLMKGMYFLVVQHEDFRAVEKVVLVD